MTQPELSDTQADELLTELVRCYSPSTEEAPAVAYLVDWMRARGFQAETDDAGNAVGTVGEGPKVLLLLGHIDTVPGSIDVHREGHLLYGRGTVDAKSPLASFAAAAARAAARSDDALAGKRVVVVGAVEEEAATSKGARHLLSRLTPDAVIIGEPSGWARLTVGYKGRLLVDYTLQRSVGHTAGPEAGVCDEAFGFWSRIQAYAADYNGDRRRIFDQLSPSMRTMHSESDGFTETAALTLGFRLPPGVDAAALRADIAEMAGEARVHFRGQEQAFHASKATPLARALIKAIDAEGGRARFQVKSGTSDMNVVAPVWQCPILAYGPGDSSLDHTPHEHIDLNEYHRAIAVLTRAIMEM